MSKNVQAIVMCLLAAGVVICGAAGGYCWLTGNPNFRPFLIATSVMGLLGVACSSKRAWLPALIGLGLASLMAFSQAHLDDEDAVMSTIAVATPGVLLAGIVGLIVYVRFKARVENHAGRLLNAGHASQAVNYLEEQLQTKDLSVGGWNMLSLAYGNLEKWPEALKAVEEAIARGGPNPVLMNNKGIFLYKSGQAAAALPLVEDASRRFPNNWVVACNLGLVLAELGRRGQAEAALRRAEKLAASKISADGDHIHIGTNRQVREQELERLRDKIARMPAANVSPG